MDTDKDYKVGYKKPPKNRQFGKPEGNKRGRGFWDINDTPRAKLEQMMKLSHKELQEFALEEDNPLFDRKLAKFIADNDWKTYKEMIAEVYGTPKQSLDVTSGGDKIKTVVEIIDARSKSTDT